MCRFPQTDRDEAKNNMTAFHAHADNMVSFYSADKGTFWFMNKS